MSKTVEKIRVRYGETDQMGHAYYANYLYWFEQARGSWCRDHGFTYKSLEAKGVKLPVVEAHANYRGEVLYDDDILVTIWVSEVRRASFRFDYEIHHAETGKLCTTGHTWHVVMGEARKAISIPDYLRAVLEQDLPAESAS